MIENYSTKLSDLCVTSRTLKIIRECCVHSEVISFSFRRLSVETEAIDNSRSHVFGSFRFVEKQPYATEKSHLEC